MKKLKKTLYFALIASEASHIFCCVLPTVFSILSLLAGLGMVGAVPLWMQGVHDLMHSWEVPVILFSGVIILLGWAIHYYSERIDCHDHGCSHGPCGPSKAKSSLILKVATILFLINILIYGIFHRGMNVLTPPQVTMEETQGHLHNDADDHHH